MHGDRKKVAVVSKTMRQIFAEALIEFAAVFPQMVVLDADVSSSTQTRLFQSKYPDRFFNFGIAEGNMAAAAAGLAACGKIPVVSTFAFLLAGRAMDSIYSTIAYNRLNVKICGGYAGLSDFADGASHQAICDLAIMRAMPNLRILVPSDADTTRLSVKKMLEYDGPVYLRLSRNEVMSVHGKNVNLEFGEMIEIKGGEDIAIIVTGTMLLVALRVREMLIEYGISAQVLEAISLKPLGEEAICRAAMQTRCVVTIEEHSIIGGLGEAVCSTLCANYPAPVLRIGVRDSFGQSARSYAQLLHEYGLSAERIVSSILNFANKRFN